MSSIDYGAVATWGLSGLAFGFFLSLTLYVALRSLMFEVLGSPVVQAIGRGATSMSSALGKGGADWKSIAAKGGMKILGKWFGVEDEK